MQYQRVSRYRIISLSLTHTLIYSFFYKRAWRVSRMVDCTFHCVRFHSGLSIHCHFATLPFLSINLWTIKLPYGIYPSAYNIYYMLVDKFHTLWGGNFIVHRLINRNGSVWKFIVLHGLPWMWMEIQGVLQCHVLSKHSQYTKSICKIKISGIQQKQDTRKHTMVILCPGDSIWREEMDSLNQYQSC